MHECLFDADAVPLGRNTCEETGDPVSGRLIDFVAGGQIEAQVKILRHANVGTDEQRDLGLEPCCFSLPSEFDPERKYDFAVVAEVLDAEGREAFGGGPEEFHLRDVLRSCPVHRWGDADFARRPPVGLPAVAKLKVQTR